MSYSTLSEVECGNPDVQRFLPVKRRL